MNGKTNAQDTSGTGRPRRQPPVLGRRLGSILSLLLLPFALLAVNSLYLTGITVAEAVSGQTLQGYIYLVMVLVHLALGLILIPVLTVFVAGHLRRAWSRNNRYATGAGIGLAVVGAILVISGLMLVRFDFLELHHPLARDIFYWVHVITPLVAVWLFVLHRLAGPPLRWQQALTKKGHPLPEPSTAQQLAGHSDTVLVSPCGGFHDGTRGFGTSWRPRSCPHQCTFRPADPSTPPAEATTKAGLLSNRADPRSDCRKGVGATLIMWPCTHMEPNPARGRTGTRCFHEGTSV